MVSRLIIFAGLLLAAAARGGTPVEEFSRANDYYSRGEYSRAADIYRDLAERGWESPELYYNLGNAHFKLDQLGYAIANYRRAWRLSPRDPEINFNLSHARRFLRDDLPGRPAGAGERVQHYLAGLLPPAAWETVSAVVYFLVVGAAAGGAAFRTQRGAATAAMKYLLPLLVLSLLATGAVHHYHARERGVVVDPELPVRYGPGQEDLTAFVLHEGTEARVFRRREGWKQILLPDGKTGWVPSGSLEII